MKQNPDSDSQGFTLAEIMVATAVSSVVSTAAFGARCLRGFASAAGFGVTTARGFGVSSTVMWHIRLWMLDARPRARARKRFSVGPSSTYAVTMTRSSPFQCRSGRDSAFATADRSTFSTSSATARVENGHVAVSLQNTATVAALATKLTLLQADGTRVLPAYYSDNYVSLLPGERREITVEYPQGTGATQIGIRGWNVISQTVPVK